MEKDLKQKCPVCGSTAGNYQYLGFWTCGRCRSEWVIENDDSFGRQPYVLKRSTVNTSGLDFEI